MPALKKLKMKIRMSSRVREEKQLKTIEDVLDLVAVRETNNLNHQEALTPSFLKGTANKAHSTTEARQVLSSRGCWTWS